MKKRTLFTGMTVLPLAAWLILSGCDNGSNPNVPAAPSGVTATAVSAGTISVSWDAVPGALSYDVYYTTGASTTKKLAANTLGTSYIHTGLNDGAIYNYCISAKNSYGSSRYSLFASAATKEFVYKHFWAYNFNTDQYYQFNAVLLAEGSYCNVWVETGKGIREATAQGLADVYDTGIYPKMINTFGIPITYEGRSFANPMDFADWLGDDDGKLTILVFSIRGANIDGYFWAGDLFNQSNSNRRDMINLNIDQQSRINYTTLAHETQHIMNFATGLAVRGQNLTQDTWIDEGLSSAAEWVYADAHTQWKIDWFNNGIFGLIPIGNNFFVWDNRQYNTEAIFDDYATVYLFFQWLRLEAGSSGIYKDIIASNYSNYAAVTGAINTKAPDKGYDAWETLLKTWLVANCINAADGPYGYKNDPALTSIGVYAAPVQAASTVSLYPGEGVYSATNSAPDIAGQGSNIRNTYLDIDGQVNDTLYYNEGAMITYNINTDISGNYEAGRVASVSQGIGPGAGSAPAGRYANTPPTSPPAKIDARDLLRRNGMEKSGPVTGGN